MKAGWAVQDNRMNIVLMAELPFCAALCVLLSEARGWVLLSAGTGALKGKSSIG